MNENISSEKIYKSEIDGLRAFAVVVYYNHFNKELLPNGYLGVDIFCYFRIRHNVISVSKTKYKLQDFITGFYERRVKRLVPAL